MKKIKNSYLIAAAVFILGAGIGWLMARPSAIKCGADYQWLNPALGCSSKSVISKAAYLTFKNKLAGQIDTWKKESKVKEAAVFFRDLENGPIFGINDREKFIPASLLKMPLMLTYFKLAEDDPFLLAQKLIYNSASPAPDRPQTISSEQILELDRPYTIDELIFRMAAYSDNRAYNLLVEYLKTLSRDNLILETYNELGMVNPGDDLKLATLSTKTYSSIFRLLYNASYLSKELSEKALEYLTRADYEGGLRKGVPENIPIAHKFGERKLENITQLHDCGIVYYPKNPYLLCVFTRGDDFNGLSNTIAAVAKMVYEEVDSRHEK